MKGYLNLESVLVGDVCGDDGHALRGVVRVATLHDLDLVRGAGVLQITSRLYSDAVVSFVAENSSQVEVFD